MTSTTSRRRYLTLLSVSAAVGLAGCSSGGSADEPGSEDDDADPAGEDGDGGGSDGGDSAGGEDPSGEEPLADGDDDSGDEPVADGDGDDDGESSGDTRLRDVIRWDSSYVMTFESPTGSGDWTVHEGDAHMRWTNEGETMETYHIGTDYYTIVDGQCYRRTVEESTSDFFDPEEPAMDDLEYFVSGTDTIDGEAVYVFDIGDGAYSISRSTGYPLRFEGYEDGTVVTLHSWGNTAPIQPPDLECFSR